MLTFYGTPSFYFVGLPLSNVGCSSGHAAGVAGAQQHRELPHGGGGQDDREGQEL